jgi:hypothetical protein
MVLLKEHEKCFQIYIPHTKCMLVYGTKVFLKLELMKT